MVICSVDVLKKSAKKKDTEIEKEIVDILQQASDLRKKAAFAIIGYF